MRMIESENNRYEEIANVLINNLNLDYNQVTVLDDGIKVEFLYGTLYLDCDNPNKSTVKLTNSLINRISEEVYVYNMTDYISRTYEMSNEIAETVTELEHIIDH